MTRRRTSILVADEDPDRFLLELMDSAGDLQGTVAVMVRQGVVSVIVEGETRRRAFEVELATLSTLPVGACDA